MAPDDEDCRTRGGEKDGPGWMENHPAGKWEQGGGDYTAERKITGCVDDHQKNEQDRQERKRGQPGEGSDETGDGFAPFETEPRREGVSGEHGKRGEARPQYVATGEPVGKKDGKPGFGCVEDEGEQAQHESGGSVDVGGTDVAGAGLPDILSGLQFDQQEAERDASEDVGDGDREKTHVL